MLKRIVFVGISLLITLLFAQAPDTLWTKTYGGVAGGIGRSVKQTMDKGYIITGWTSFGNDFEVYLIKTDSFGDTLWTRTYGGEYEDTGFSVLQTSDSGYIIAGRTYSFGASYSEVYLIKTDNVGDTLWTKMYGDHGGSPSYNWAESIQKTVDGGYIIAGTYRLNNGYLLRTDSFGDTLWTRWFGGPQKDQLFSVQQTADSGYITVGYTESWGAGSCDVYLVKTDSLGDTLWTRTYGGIHDDVGKSVQQISSGGYIIVGTTVLGGPGYTDVYLIKTDSFGDTLWTRTYGGANIHNQGESVLQTADGGYIITGSTSLGAGWTDFWLIRTDAIGDTLWTKTIGGSEREISYSVQVTADGGYIITGFTDSYGAGGRNVYLVKTEPDVGIHEGTVLPIGGNQLTPIIISGPLLLPEDKTCRVFDITGRAVVLQHIKPGIYFIEIDGEIRQKVVKIR
ncbi:MAG: hypothetical protein WBB37_11915 [bacterium]